MAVSRVYVHGSGVVSPAGWGMEPFRQVLERNIPLPGKELPRTGWDRPLMVRQVPPPASRPPFLAHARLRRASPITQYVVAAALEALAGDQAQVANGTLRLGLVLCVMSGCVNYSRRFYDETLHDPATASPLVFPETVFNSPASHLAAMLGATAMNYTLVGDPGTFLQGLGLAAHWLTGDSVDACLVVGGEESDWLTADANRLFSRQAILGEGAGALYLRSTLNDGALAELQFVTGSHLFTRRQSRRQAAQLVRASLPTCSANQMLFDSRQQSSRLDAAETSAWKDWTSARVSIKSTLGEAFAAAAAWQCIAAIDAFQRIGCTAASVSVVGCNQQAIGAHTKVKTKT